MSGREKQLSPIDKGTIHNTAVGANADFFATDLSPSNPPCVFKIMAVLNTAKKLQADITRGANEQTVALNADANLTAGAVHEFNLLVHSGDTINFQTDGALTIQVFRVQEIPSSIT
jgi:hypothetical protein